MDRYEIIALNARTCPQWATSYHLPSGLLLCRWWMVYSGTIQMPDQPCHSLFHIRYLFLSWQWRTLNHHYG
jgi:hypothetical protein